MRNKNVVEQASRNDGNAHKLCGEDDEDDYEGEERDGCRVSFKTSMPMQCSSQSLRSMEME